MQIRFTKFKDWGIKIKLLLLTILTLGSIVFLSFTSSYFFNTSRTLTIMINGVRVHQSLLQSALENIYQFKISNNPQLLDSSANQLNKANLFVNDLLKMRSDYSLKSNAEIATYLYERAPEIYNYEFENAKMVVRRLRLLNRLKNEDIKNSRKLIDETLHLVDKIRNDLLNDKENINLDSTQQQIVKIQKLYTGFSSEIDSLANKFNRALIWAMIGIAFLLAIVILLLSRYISNSISIPTQQMVDNFKQIARGNFHTPLSINSKDEIGALAYSFKIIQQDFQNVIAYTHKVAKGDFSMSLTPKSEDDELSFSLNKMVKTLQDSKAINDKTLWLRSGVNQLNEVLQGDQNLNQFSNKSIAFMTDFLQAELGAIYVYQKEEEIFNLTASVGLPNKNKYRTIHKGDGLIGQVAINKQLKHIENIPEDYFTIFSGSGEIKPSNLLIVPLIFNDTLWAVMELASIHKFKSSEIEFIKSVRESITVKIASTLARTQLETLLNTTQQQANELQVQQEELRVANEELEERTNQLEIQKEEILNKNIHLSQTHEKLETKARELEQTNQYKTDFLANMSHELRTPLNSLLILSSLLVKNKKGNLDSEDIESVEIINKSGADLLQLINEILDLSKIEAGKMSMHFEKVNPKSIAQNILQKFKHQAKKKKIDFTVTIDKDFPKSIKTDSLRLSQILRNLISNAFKFTSKGSVSLSMKKMTDHELILNKKLKKQESCIFIIRDTGVGIADEKKEAIFEAFQQADSSTSRKYGGTGLGLSISKELARMLDGEIQLQSKSGEGSEFSLILPIKPFESLPANTQEVEEQPISETPISLPFFIDDDRDIPHAGPIVIIIHPRLEEAKALYNQIHENHFQALVASNAEDAIRLIEAHHASAIILGIELLMKNKAADLDRLKSHPSSSNLPIHIVNPMEGITKDEQKELPKVNASDISITIEKIQKELFTDPKKILLVEDNSLTRNVIKSLLQSTHADIVEVSTGIEAFKQIRETNYDCVILDLQLPDFTGNKLLAKLADAKIAIPNTIIYTEKDLSREEHRELSKYTNSIILKGLKSDERLMDEVTLFLHHVSTTMPNNPEIKIPEIDDSIFKGKKVLIVDDEIRNVFALGKILEDREMEVLEAENGKVAIEVLQNNPSIDIVLMDIMMPEMDGYEAMKIIRQKPKIKNIPIICLTAKAMKEDYEKAISSGANDYLSKPVDENQLFSMLKIWLYN
jgi:signal transduction histidine kinase/CheY-like chemotaxis protein/HAMP domain-containing protein